MPASIAERSRARLILPILRTRKGRKGRKGINRQDEASLLEDNLNNLRCAKDVSLYFELQINAVARRKFK